MSAGWILQSELLHRQKKAALQMVNILTSSLINQAQGWNMILFPVHGVWRQQHITHISRVTERTCLRCCKAKTITMMHISAIRSVTAVLWILKRILTLKVFLHISARSAIFMRLPMKRTCLCIYVMRCIMNTPLNSVTTRRLKCRRLVPLAGPAAEEALPR